MNKIEQFKAWYLNAKPNDKYTYHVGSLAFENIKENNYE